ncbi:MAG TPA: MerR family transcriptional regulator, partial [Caulobacteraceae bacterium]|nr:MerR family transcriptional regulator [Caulobacteraceae bacterium]
MTGEAEYTIDELAREAGATVRNIRAYQERGILPPPRRQGRVGLYGPAHLARLKIIGSMLARGYTLANVGELVEAWEQGHNVAEVIGLEAAVTSPWTDEAPTRLTTEQMMQLLGAMPDPHVLNMAIQLDVVRPAGDGFIVPSMKLLNVAVTLMREGVPLTEQMVMIAELRRRTEEIAEGLVAMVVRHIFDVYGKDSLPPREEAPRLSALIWRLRPLVMQAVDSEVARAMEKAAQKHLGERLAHVMEHMHEDEP